MPTRRVGIIPRGGSIPRGQLKVAAERHSMQRQNNFSNDAASPWKPHVIAKKPPQKQKKSLSLNSAELRNALEEKLKWIRQEFAEVRDMAQKEGEKYNIGFPQYLSLLEKKISDIGVEIRKLQ